MSADRDAVLDELASVLHGQGCGEVCVCVDDARALLPVVQALVAEGAAAELRAAADWFRGSSTETTLRDRATVLTAGSEANR